MNLSESDCGLTVRVPATSLDTELQVQPDAILTFPKNDLALTLSYSGGDTLDCITVIFPGDPKTVFIRDVTSDSPGRIVTFRRPAPRVAEIDLQSIGGPPKEPFTIHLRVSSPILQKPAKKPVELPVDYKVFVMAGPWPPGYQRTRTARRNIDEFLERQTGPKFKDKPELLKAKRFFLEYDYATHPLLLGAYPIEAEDKAIRSALVQKCLPILQQRVRMRGHCAMISDRKRVPAIADFAKVCLTSDEGGIDAPLEKAEVAYLSALQREIFEQHFPESKTGNLTALRNAFVSFVNGELRDESPEEGKTRMGQPTDASNGEPDSAHVFFFAEFACLALEHKVDFKFWTAVLPILSGIQPIYVIRYGGTRQPGSRGKFDENTFNKYGPNGFDQKHDRIEIDIGRIHSQEGLLLKIGENILDAFGECPPVDQAAQPGSPSVSSASSLSSPTTVKA